MTPTTLPGTAFIILSPVIALGALVLVLVLAVVGERVKG
jgi:hypothetical protein